MRAAIKNKLKITLVRQKTYERRIRENENRLFNSHLREMKILLNNPLQRIRFFNFNDSKKLRGRMGLI